MHLKNSYLGKASKTNLWGDANQVTASKNFGETQFGMTYHIEDGGNTELGGMSPNILTLELAPNEAQLNDRIPLL